MSLVHSLATSTSLAVPRKRTSSFSCPTTSLASNPRPKKAARTSSGMGSLRRTESFIILPGFQSTSSIHMATPSSQMPSAPHDVSALVPYNRTLRHYKEQRERRKALLNRTMEPITIRTHPEATHTLSTPRHVPQSQLSSRFRSTQPSKLHRIQPSTPLPSVSTSPRTSSPLAPKRTQLPGRPIFPRSRPEPDLYRKAITTRMQCSSEGQQILRMGPRLAISIITATRELERLVAAQGEREDDFNDVAMTDSAPVMTSSWVVVQGDDWEMLDCKA